MGHRSMIVLALLAIGLVAVSTRGQGEASAKDKWTKAERDKGYVVFAYSTMKNLPAGHVPRRDSTVNRLTCVSSQQMSMNRSNSVCTRLLTISRLYR